MASFVDLGSFGSLQALVKAEMSAMKPKVDTSHVNSFTFNPEASSVSSCEILLYLEHL